MDRETWWVTVHGVTKSRTQLNTNTFKIKIASLSAMVEGRGGK